MLSSTCGMESKKCKSLHDFLEEEQEPFFLQEYLQDKLSSLKHAKKSHQCNSANHGKKINNQLLCFSQILGKEKSHKKSKCTTRHEDSNGHSSFAYNFFSTKMNLGIRKSRGINKLKKNAQKQYGDCSLLKSLKQAPKLSSIWRENEKFNHERTNNEGQSSGYDNVFSVNWDAISVHDHHPTKSIGTFTTETTNDLFYDQSQIMAPNFCHNTETCSLLEAQNNYKNEKCHSKMACLSFMKMNFLKRSDRVKNGGENYQCQKIVHTTKEIKDERRCFFSTVQPSRRIHNSGNGNEESPYPSPNSVLEAFSEEDYNILSPTNSPSCNANTDKEIVQLFNSMEDVNDSQEEKPCKSTMQNVDNGLHLEEIEKHRGNLSHLQQEEEYYFGGSNPSVMVNCSRFSGIHKCTKSDWDISRMFSIMPLEQPWEGFQSQVESVCTNIEHAIFSLLVDEFLQDFTINL